MDEHLTQTKRRLYHEVLHQNGETRPRLGIVPNGALEYSNASDLMFGAQRVALQRVALECVAVAVLDLKQQRVSVVRWRQSLADGDYVHPTEQCRQGREKVPADSMNHSIPANARPMPG